MLGGHGFCELWPELRDDSGVDLRWGKCETTKHFAVHSHNQDLTQPVYK